MKKLVSVMLIACVFAAMVLPVSGLAEETVDYDALIRMAEQIIANQNREEIYDYDYAAVLGIILLIKSRQSFDAYKETESKYEQLQSIDNADSKELMDAMFEVLAVRLNWLDEYKEMMLNAAELYESGDYNFDVLKKHLDMLKSVQ